MAEEKLLIAEYGYDNIRDAPMQTKIELERYCRQSDANSELSQARVDALLAGAFGLTSIMAAVVASPALIVTVPFTAFFAHAAMSERDKALLHATSATVQIARCKLPSINTNSITRPSRAFMTPNKKGDWPKNSPWSADGRPASNKRRSLQRSCRVSDLHDRYPPRQQNHAECLHAAGRRHHHISRRLG